VGIAVLNNQVITLSAITDTIVNGFPNTADLRISLISNEPVPSESVTATTGPNPMSLYVHKYRGDKVSLYDKDLKRWKTYTLSGAPISQALVSQSEDAAPLPGGKNYDVYLSNVEETFEVTFEAWSNSNVGQGPTNRSYIDGVCVHANDSGKRLIGCIRTTDNGKSEQTFGGIDAGGAPIKQFVWNAQNQVPVTFACWEKESYEVGPEVSWRPVNGNENFRFSFIAGDRQYVDIVGQIYALSGHEAYTSFVIDSTTLATPSVPEVTVGGEVFTPHGSLSASASPVTHLKKTFDAGYHFCQQVEKYTSGGLYSTITVNNNQPYRTGFIVSTHL
jgi:hypothetical protein